VAPAPAILVADAAPNISRVSVTDSAVVTPPVEAAPAMTTASPTSAVTDSPSGVAAAVVSLPAPPTAASVALEKACGAAARQRARDASSGKDAAIQRLGRYITAVIGRRAGNKTLEAATSLVASAAAMEDENEDFQVVIHVSGVSSGGDLGWASIYGQGSYVDPDALRVFGNVHQFCRGRDLLSRAHLHTDAPPARLMGTCHRGGRPLARPSTPAPLPTSAEDQDYLEAFTSPADSFLPPPLSVQRLARQVARGRSSSRSSSFLDDGLPVGAPSTRDGASAAASPSAGDEGGAGSEEEGDNDEAVAQLLPFVLELVTAPEHRTPRKSAVAFMKDLYLERRAPVQLVRATLKAAIIFCAMRFGLAPRNIQEGFSRWWPHQLVPNQSADGEVVAYLCYQLAISHG